MDAQAFLEAMVAWWIRNETGTSSDGLAADLLIHGAATLFGESTADATARVSAMIDEARTVTVG